jgi:hypothetical protein
VFKLLERQNLICRRLIVCIVYEWSLHVRQHHLHLVPRRPLPVLKFSHFHELHCVCRRQISFEHGWHELHSVCRRQTSLEHGWHGLHSMRRRHISFEHGWHELHSVCCRQISLEHWWHEPRLVFKLLERQNL